MPFKSRLPDVDIPRDVSLPGLLLEKAEEYSDRIALIAGVTGDKLTYRELSDRVLCVAASLHTRGLRKGDIVFILSGNCAEFLIVYMAVTSLGAIFAAVSPLSTEEEIRYYFDDCQPTWLVVLNDFAEKALKVADEYGKMKERFVIGDYKDPGVSQLAELYAGRAADAPVVEIDPLEDVSSLLYSSGTTGRPKGVLLTHYAQIANLYQFGHSDELKDIYRDDHAKNYIGLLPFYHSAGVIMSLVIWYEGHTSILFPRFDMVKFLETVQNYSIEVLVVVPPIVLLLSKDKIVGDYDLSCVKYLVVGAAPLSKEVEEACRERLNLVRVRQAYGMTENGPVTHITPKDIQKPGSTGILLPNNECKVVDTVSGRELGVNEDGELWVKCPGLMQSYLNRPEATADMILPDGFCKTGDIGHCDEDGHFFIVDRIKELIKYKGYQVAPAELEGLLLSHPGIADTAVIGVPETEAGELPRAYVVLKKDVKLTEDEIKKFVAGHVAPHKRLRGGVVFTDVIPKSVAGKILRRVLKQQVKDELEQQKSAK